ncbi:MAG: thioredoxin domain-containing protein [Planctomycetaceae bacterium]
MTTLPGLLVALLAASAPHSRGEVIDFSATWCGPCQSIAPTVARLERDGHPIRSVDVDQNRELAQQFGVVAMPTFVLVIDGKIVERHEGVLSESQLLAWLKRIPRDTAVAQAATSRGQSTSYVADPNVRLGTPQPMALASQSGSTRGQPLVERSAPERQQAAEFPSMPNDRQAAPARTAMNDTDVRAASSGAGDPATPLSAATPMSASVRLRVTVGGNIHNGSGTIIHCDGQQALIATCGHIFRDLGQQGEIEVNLFQGADVRSVAGRLLKFDEQADVGLVAIEVNQNLPSVNVARDVQQAQVQEPVVNIGCSGGQNPTSEELVVTAVNPYIGPDNLECTGVPVQGRSGGGLFRTTGELVGICIAADHERKRGVYAGLKPIHDLLEQCGYGGLFKAPETAVAATEGSPFDQVSSADASESTGSSRGTPLNDLAPARDFPVDQGRNATESPGFAFANINAPAAGCEQGSPIQLGSNAADAEVVCIIRSRDPNQNDSQVVIIHQASPKLLSYLRGEMGTDVGSGAAAALLSQQPRRSRAESVPTMETTLPQQSAEILPLGHTSLSQKPSLQPTILTTTVQPRRYVRMR